MCCRIHDRGVVMNKYFVMILFALLLLLVPSCGKKAEETVSPEPKVTETGNVSSSTEDTAKTVTAAEKQASPEENTVEAVKMEESELEAETVPLIPEDGEKRYEDNIFYTYSSSLGGFVVTANAVTYPKDIVIPDTVDGIAVVRIGDYAFSGNSYITGNLIIPSSVKSIGDGAFCSCKSLTGLWLSEGVESIGEEAFLDCRALGGDLFIPESVTQVGNSAFGNCDGFDGELHILGVADIGDGAFRGCDGFTALHIFKAVSVGNSAFRGCTGFRGDLIIPESVETIGENAFRYCSGFSGDLILPSSVRAIGEYAFASCTGFDGILILPSSLGSIEEGVFYDTEFSCDVIIPESVKSIAREAFVGSHVTPYFTSACIGLAAGAFTEGTIIPPELL